MRFHFIWVGKTKNKNLRALQDDYLGRLSHFVKSETSEIRDETKENEGKRIGDLLNRKGFVVALDIKGRSVSSPQLAKMIEKWQNHGLKEINFVIGGADGLAAGIINKADLVLSLSGLTLTHEFARVLLLEQLYRAFTIIKGFPYQK
jgi:23S rRNA (pseudouridine1915-N3)-methyltransferase